MLSLFAAVLIQATNGVPFTAALDQVAAERARDQKADIVLEIGVKGFALLDLAGTDPAKTLFFRPSAGSVPTSLSPRVPAQRKLEPTRALRTLRRVDKDDTGA